MVKSSVAILGVIVFVLAVGVLVVLRMDVRKAVANDQSDKPRVNVIPLGLELDIPKRVMSLHEDQVAIIKVTNEDTSSHKIEVTINAPGFDIDEAHQWDLPASESRNHSCVLRAKDAGDYHVLVQAAGYQVAKGVSVRQYGMSADLVQWFAVISAVLGPLITIPWWISFFRKQRKKQEASRIILPPGAS